MSNIPVIVSAARTAIGNFNGSLASVKASQLGATVIKSTLASTGIDPSRVDEVIMGQVLQAGEGQNGARQALLGAGIPTEVPAMSINKVCGSGLKSVFLGAQNISSPFTFEEGKYIICGGQENMSLAPRLYQNSRVANRMGNILLEDSMIKDGLWCAFNDYHMGITAENIVEKHSITREAQDDFAFSSQEKAKMAFLDGKFKDEIVPVVQKDRRGNESVFEVDEFIKLNMKREDLDKIRPAFKKNGTVTAGNASGINDGAAVVLLTDKATAMKDGLEILAEIKGFASAGVDPKVMGLGVVPALNKCLGRVGWELSDLDLLEANEAFAAQSLGVMNELGATEEFIADRVNVNGGAIALGHPIGASGCRVFVTLLHEMKRSGKKKGAATLCIGGGQGVALAVERV
eukprot:snap_masked-scaffold_5-processed-gene-19.29-mRNA-1 protein AED:0.03 eAED:0.03 QI:0/-1/0/1/-1/1/1/0/402